MTKRNKTDTATQASTLLGPLGVALLCASVLITTHLLTAQRISANTQAQASRQLQLLLADSVSAEALATARLNSERDYLCLEGTLVLQQQVRGYAGDIALLLAIHVAEPPTLTGITVTRHLETPGIADFLNQKGAQSWLARLTQRSAASLQGVDTVTGATISSKAVLQAAIASVAGAVEAYPQCQP